MTRKEKARQMISPKWKLTQEQRDAMVAAYIGGQSACSVAKTFGVTLNNVRYHVRKAGLWRGRRLPSLSRRFWEKVRKTNSCWLWMGSVFRNGYGCFSIQGKSVGAHRIAYEMTKGPIPANLTIDHLCRNKLCVNPGHLEAVSAGENTRRGHVTHGMKYTLRSHRAVQSGLMTE